MHILSNFTPFFKNRTLVLKRQTRRGNGRGKETKRDSPRGFEASACVSVSTLERDFPAEIMKYSYYAPFRITPEHLLKEAEGRIWGRWNCTKRTPNLYTCRYSQKFQYAGINVITSVNEISTESKIHIQHTQYLLKYASSSFCQNSVRNILNPLLRRIGRVQLCAFWHRLQQR